jgi:type IV pilus assembly protein PilV
MTNHDHKKSPSAPGIQAQRGISLIEVLVAVFILAVGMLSLANIQLAAKRASYEATQRSIATGLARDIVERMRNNPNQLPAYEVAGIGDEDNLLAEPGINCSNANCTPANLADYDLAEWESLLVGASEQLAGGNSGGLVAPRACITNVDGTVTVAIAWRGVASLTNPTESTCGEAAVGLYDDPDEAAGNNLRRRLLVMSTFIAGI